MERTVDVCHITSTHKRYDVRVFWKECVSLAKKGYSVTLLVNDINSDEYLEGVNIVSTGHQSKNRVERIFSQRLLYNMALSIDAKLYHIHDPDLLPLARRLKRHRKKVIFDSHEDTPAQVFDSEWIPKKLRSLVSNSYEKYENRTLRMLDAVVTVTPRIAKRLSRTNHNTVVVTNYPQIDNSDFSRLDEHFAQKPSVICFAGNISEQYHHEGVITAIEYLENVKYVLAGLCSPKYLRKLKNLPGWRNVDYLGWIPYDKVKNIYALSTLGVSIHFSNQSKDEGSLGSLKLFEYMSSGLPVVCSNYRLFQEIVENNKCGLCVDPKDINEISKAFEYIIRNPEEARRMGENGRQAIIKVYNWSSQESVLLDLYRRLLIE